MGVIVKFFASFRDITGQKQIEMPINEPIKLQQVLNRLFAIYGEDLRNSILENDQLRHLVKIFVNGRSIRWLTQLDTPIHEGDTIAIFPPIGGGWGKDQL
ncbi:MAG: ubiquitin-like small modifier protein 1 [Candidatus Hodarchaeota archaeon]